MEIIDSLCVLSGATRRLGFISPRGAAAAIPHQRRIDDVIGLGRCTAEELESLWAHCGAALTALDFDGSYVASDGSRFRVNFFRTLFKRGAVLRPIKTEVPGLETLGVPAELLASWITRPFGLVLVTGPTGAGKSTTLAACLEWLNQNYHRHIVTIEDPIEYLFTPAKCLFTQREVGSDTTHVRGGSAALAAAKPGRDSARRNSRQRLGDHGAAGGGDGPSCAGDAAQLQRARFARAAVAPVRHRRARGRAATALAAAHRHHLPEAGARRARWPRAGGRAFREPGRDAQMDRRREIPRAGRFHGEGRQSRKTSRSCIRWWR